MDGGRRATAILVHSRGDGGSVIQQRQLSANRPGILCAGGLGEFDKEGSEPGPIPVSNAFACIAGSRLRTRTDEPASTKFRSFQGGLELGKNAKKARSWRVVRGEDMTDAFLALTEVVLEVRAHELVLAAKDAVQRGLGDAGPFDNAVNAHDMHPFRVEELVGRDQQPISRGYEARGGPVDAGGLLGGLCRPGPSLSTRQHSAIIQNVLSANNGI